MPLKLEYLTGGSGSNRFLLLLLVLHSTFLGVTFTVVQADQCEEGQYWGTCPPPSVSTGAPSNLTTPTGSPVMRTGSPTTALVWVTEIEDNMCCDCDTSCKTCNGSNKNECLTCHNDTKPAFLPKYCDELLTHVCPNSFCSSNCTGEKDVCQCMLKQGSCGDCLTGMKGECVGKDECPKDTQAKEYQFATDHITVCIKCDGTFIGYCVQRYREWIIAFPIAIFVVLLVVIVIFIYCCVFRRRGEDKRPVDTPMVDYPTVSRPSHSNRGTGNSGVRVDHDDQVSEIQEVDDHDDGDIYGNVDSRNNVMLQNAPSAEHTASLHRAKAPNFNAAVHSAYNELENDQDQIYGNQETIGKDDVSYIHMKENVHIDQPRLPPGGAEESDEEQPIYGNQQQPIGRHVSTPVRLPPSIPQKKNADTFPANMKPSFASGQDNRGYNDDDGQDDYPDIRELGQPPPPPDKGRSPLSPPKINTAAKPWERTGAGPGGAGPSVNELQQKFNKLNKKPEPETPDDLPSMPPPPIPGGFGGRGGLSELQQGLKAGLVQRKLSDSRPGPPVPPVKAKPAFSKLAESSSDEEQDEYEFVDYHDDDKPKGQPPPKPSPTKTKDPALRPKLAPPVKKKTPPAVPTKPSEPQEVYEVMDTEEEKDRPRLPPPGEPDDQEVYEPVDTSGQSGELYEVTDPDGKKMGSSSAPFQLEEDDIYQNAPAVKNTSKSGRYRNLPADPMRHPIKEGGYAKWSHSK